MFTPKHLPRGLASALPMRTAIDDSHFELVRPSQHGIAFEVLPIQTESRVNWMFFIAEVAPLSVSSI